MMKSTPGINIMPIIANTQFMITHISLDLEVGSFKDCLEVGSREDTFKVGSFEHSLEVGSFEDLVTGGSLADPL